MWFSSCILSFAHLLAKQGIPQQKGERSRRRTMDLVTLLQKLKKRKSADKEVSAYIEIKSDFFSNKFCAAVGGKAAGVTLRTTAAVA